MPEVRYREWARRKPSGMGARTWAWGWAARAEPRAPTGGAPRCAAGAPPPRREYVRVLQAIIIISLCRLTAKGSLCSPFYSDLPPLTAYRDRRPIHGFLIVLWFDRKRMS